MIGDMPHISFGREIANVLLRAGVVVGTIIFLFIIVGVMYESEQRVSDGECNIAVLPIEGIIVPFVGLEDYPLAVTPRAVEEFMSLAEADPAIKAVLLEINSPGGTPVASEQIAARVHDSSLPVVGLVGDLGASGGYMVAAATDHLLASAMSTVGSIGVTMSYVEESKKNEEDGLTFVELAAGKYKDAGNPNKPLTAEERALFERDLTLIHDAFIDIVAKYRDLPREDVVALADGSTMPGVRAVESKLIDEIGGRSEAKIAIAQLTDTPVDDLVYCEYQQSLFGF